MVNKITTPPTQNEVIDKINELVDDKQDTLVSGTNIKTLNGSSLLGSGNIVAGTYYGVSTSAATDAEKVVSIPSITSLDEGTVIIVQPTITSTVANSTIKLNDFPAYPMRYSGAAITTSSDSIVWNASFPTTWVFDGDYWVFVAHGIDSNSTYTMNYSFDAGQYTAGSGTYAITRYSLVMQKPDGTWEKTTDTASTHSTGTSKTVNRNGFLLNQIRYYGTTTRLGNGALVASNVMYEKTSKITFAYSANCGTAPGWAIGDYIYLVGTMGADGLFYLDTTQWWDNALPTTNDGKLYIRLGIALTTTDSTMSFFDDRPIFYHDGTKICEYKVADNKQDKLVSGTNIKTINNQSLLGSGNISISTGGTATDVKINGTSITSNNEADIKTNGTYNATSNKIATMSDIPTNVSSFTNDSGYITSSALSGYATETWVGNQGYITGITSSDVTTALGYTPYDANNPNGYTTNTGTVTSVNNVSPVNGNVTLSIPTVPTNVSAFTNDAGYITSSALNGYATETWVGQQGYITGITSSDVTTALGYTPYNSSNPSGFITSSALAPYVLSSSLATVATSGSYNDLSNQPTIPTTTSSVTSGSSAALTSGGAYTALQSYQTTANLVTSVSSSSTNSQYPSAKLFYDTCGDIETLINAL